jgi:proteasome lid subunit RPN8/RPN11
MVGRIEKIMSLRAQNAGVPRVEESHLPDEIVWLEDTNVYKPSPRSLADFLSSIEIIPHSRVSEADQDGSLLLFLEQGCMQTMEAHARREILREQAGILCGQAFSYGNEKLYVEVTSAIAVHARAGAAHFRFHKRSWDEVWQEMEPGANVVGWYHTHPGMGVFLSQTDLRTQKLYFQSPWQIAVVIDPVSGTSSVFSGSAGVKVPEDNCFCYLRKR